MSSSKQKPKQKLLDVYGIVDGVSDLLRSVELFSVCVTCVGQLHGVQSCCFILQRNGPSRLFLIRLKDVSTRDSYIVTVMVKRAFGFVNSCL